ncbi:MAG TPA: prephenate dehydrogenase/arogenate dehydrogenase family protein [Solirubrobacteraceae bacterium]|nr:prephenate dehydrogenase/arogenate dehydrogenase family protein [Solirubrobacteraceae bacterium]
MRVAVIGLGLIGGSIALAARERLAAEVCGWDSEAAAIEAAVAHGAISSGAGSLASAVAEADVVFTAAPVDALPQLVGEALAHAPAGAVITDVGSTKRTIVEAINDSRFIGGHPLAGAETSGVQNASAGLFDASTWYLTPGARTAATAVSRVAELIGAFGAGVQQLDAGEHDRLMAAVSHLPHVFANVLLSHLLATGAPPVLGPSFRDATRVAGSNPAVWSSIYLDNRDEVVAAIDHAIELLQSVRADLGRGDAGALMRWCEQAAADRRSLGR